MTLCQICGKPVRPTKMVNYRICDNCERHDRDKKKKGVSNGKDSEDQT